MKINKLKTNNYGFGHMEIILVVLVVAIIGVVGFTVFNNHKTSSSLKATASTTIAPPVSNTPAATYSGNQSFDAATMATIQQKLSKQPKLVNSTSSNTNNKMIAHNCPSNFVQFIGNDGRCYNIYAWQKTYTGGYAGFAMCTQWNSNGHVTGIYYVVGLNPSGPNYSNRISVGLENDHVKGSSLITQKYSKFSGWFADAVTAGHIAGAPVGQSNYITMEYSDPYNVLSPPFPDGYGSKYASQLVNCAQ